jgi:hypothetical protein
MADRNARVSAERCIRFRIGINLGDIIIDKGDIFGDGVNFVARLEALAEPGGICVSQVVLDQVRDKLDFVFEDMGEQQVKNILRPVHAHRYKAAALYSLRRYEDALKVALNAHRIRPPGIARSCWRRVMPNSVAMKRRKRRSPRWSRSQVAESKRCAGAWSNGPIGPPGSIWPRDSARLDLPSHEAGSSSPWHYFVPFVFAR